MKRERCLKSTYCSSDTWLGMQWQTQFNTISLISTANTADTIKNCASGSSLNESLKCHACLWFLQYIQIILTRLTQLYNNLSFQLQEESSVVLNWVHSKPSDCCVNNKSIWTARRQDSLERFLANNDLKWDGSVCPCHSVLLCFIQCSASVHPLQTRPEVIFLPSCICEGR